MLSPLDLLILALATWRLSYMLVAEYGPADVFKRLRAHATLGGLLKCQYCVSIWAALALWLLWRTPLWIITAVLAISGGAIMLGSYSGAGYVPPSGEN